MNEFLIQYLQQAAEIARHWGPFLILFFMAVESSFIPFPSEVVMIPAGFMAARHELFPGDPLSAAAFAVACGVAGSMLGATVNYALALYVGRPFLHRHGRWFLLSPHALDRAEEIFREYGDVATFVCRLLPAIRQLISLPAGLSRMDFRRFSFFTALGAGLWVTILTAIGYRLGVEFRDMSYRELVLQGGATLHHYMGWIVLGCAVIFAGYVWIHRRVMGSAATRAESRS